MRFSGSRLAPAIVGAAGFVLLCIASLHRRPSGPAPLPERRSPELSPAAASRSGVDQPVAVPDSQNESWYLKGDPALIARIIAEIDEAQRSGRDARELHGRLIRDMANLLGQNHIHSLPLMKRILCDPNLPAELKKCVLALDSTYTAPEAALFLANLIAHGKVTPDVHDDAIMALARLYGGVLREEMTDALRSAGHRAFDAIVASTNPQARAAAITTFFTLGNSPDPVETLVRLFRNDPEFSVRSAASNTLRLVAQGNGKLAEEMAGMVSRSDDFWTRFCALGVLIATRTELAKKTVVTCLHDPDPGIRRTAIWGVSEFKLTEQAPLLDRWLAGPERGDDVTRLYCIRALKDLATPESARVLLRYLSTEEDLSLRGQAASSLEAHPALAGEELTDELIHLYEQGKNTPDAEILAGMLGVNKSRRAYEVLNTAYQSAPPEKKSDLASILLGYSHGPTFASEHFAELLQTDQARSAVRALAEGNPDVAVAQLAKAYDLQKMTEETREAAVRVLGDIGSAKALEALQGFLKIETDADLQRWIQRLIDRILDED